MKYLKGDNNKLYAFDEKTGVFVMFNFKNKEWEIANCSYFYVLEDLHGQELLEKEVDVITQGNKPEALINQYVNYLKPSDSLEKE